MTAEELIEFLSNGFAEDKVYIEVYGIQKEIESVDIGDGEICLVLKE